MKVTTAPRCNFRWSAKNYGYHQETNRQHVCPLPAGHSGEHICDVTMYEHDEPYDCTATHNNRNKWVPPTVVLLILVVLFLIWRFT